MSSDKKNLSYSGYSTYTTCPYKYYLQYNRKLVPDSTPSHLIFGSAVDKALNEILQNESNEKALKAAQDELGRLFTENVELIEQDFDGDIITSDTNEILVDKLRETGWEGSSPEALAKTLFDQLTFSSTLSDGQQKALKILVFFSFLEKVQLIIQSFIDYVQPQIEEVVSNQKYVKRGILDFEAKFKGIEGIVTCDNKTASKDYAPDSVRGSVQLAGYGATKGAYIVFNKTVRKNRTKTCPVCGNIGTGKRHKTCDADIEGQRCNSEWIETISPEIIPQVIIDDVSDHTRTMVEAAYQDTEKLIECGVFPKNLNNCGKQYGKPCPYINFCWNDDMKGLIKNERK